MTSAGHLGSFLNITARSHPVAAWSESSRENWWSLIAISLGLAVLRAAVLARAAMGMYKVTVFYPDLGTATQIVEGPYVRAVGWLDAGHSFSCGQLDGRVRDRITMFSRAWSASVSALGWPVAAGPHLCDFCRSFRASGTFGVPDSEILYVCPEMIAHYVEAHSYLPPAGFVAAILRSPLPGSAEYDPAVSAFRRVLGPA